MSIKQDGHLALQNTSTSATAGSNGAPPAQVAGYFVFETLNSSGISTGLVKVPYYNT
jgi:hypothetical protein